MSSEVQPLVHTVPREAGAAFGPISTLQQVGAWDRWRDLPGELPLAVAAASGALRLAGPGTRVDRVAYVSSVPPQVPHMGAFALADAVGLTPGHVVDVGNNCAALLDALWLATTLWRDQTNLVVAATRLGQAVGEEMRATKPGSRQWGDGAAAILLGGAGPSSIRPLAYVTAVDPSLHAMLEVCPTETGYRYTFQQEIAERFQATDLDNELRVIGEAIAAADITAGDLAGVIVVNRGRRRTLALAPAFGIDSDLVISSRSEIGHGGGADLLFNVDRLLSRCGPGTHRVVFVGNGLGYMWSTLVVEIEISP